MTSFEFLSKEHPHILIESSNNDNNIIRQNDTLIIDHKTHFSSTRSFAPYRQIYFVDTR